MLCAGEDEAEWLQTYSLCLVLSRIVALKGERFVCEVVVPRVRDSVYEAI
jgi:hypothetical protein